MSKNDFKVNEDEKSGQKENDNSELVDDIAHAKTKLKEWMTEHPAIKNLRDKYGKKPTPDTSTPNIERRDIPVRQHGLAGYDTLMEQRDEHA
jgi:hypothetical protein